MRYKRSLSIPLSMHPAFQVVAVHMPCHEAGPAERTLLLDKVQTSSYQGLSSVLRWVLPMSEKLNS